GARANEKSRPRRSSPFLLLYVCPSPRPSPRWRGEGEGESGVPAERLRLALRALAELDVDDARAGEVHQLVERAANVLGVLDIGAVAAERLHHLVVSGAVDQRVRPHVEHRV